MPTHAEDIVFIVFAYAGAVLAVAGLVAASWLGARRARARLAALEAQGIRRRSSA